MRLRASRPWLVLPWLFLAAAGDSGGAAPASEDTVKAAFTFRFTQFVDWPAAGAESKAPFVLGVLGEGPMGAALAEMVRGERIAGRPLVVRRLRSPDEAADCQILYVSSDGEGLFREARLQGAPVLTVGESDDFLREGGMIELYTDHNHVRLRINLAAARGASLQVSSKLLRVAQVITP